MLNADVDYCLLEVKEQDSELLGAIDPATAFGLAKGAFSLGKKLFGKKVNPNAQHYDYPRAQAELFDYIISYYPPPKYEPKALLSDRNIKEQIGIIVKDAQIHGGASTYENLIVKWVDEVVGPDNFRHLFRDTELETQLQIELAELEKQIALYRRKATEDHSSNNKDFQEQYIKYGLIGIGVIGVGVGGYFIFKK